MASHEILLFSDIHLDDWKFGSTTNSSGFNSRLTSGLAVIDRIYEEASSRNISTVIFTGDLFHVRQGVSSQVLHRTFECFKNNSYSHSDIEMYLMLGNHDFTRDMKFSAVNCLTSIPRIKVISQQNTCYRLFGGEVQAHFVPYTPDSVIFKGEIAPSKLQIPWPDVHFVHQGFSDLAQDPRNYYIDEIASVEDMSQWFKGVPPEIISGHYHDHALLTGKDVDLNSLYGFFVGAPQQHNFGDAGTKRGFLTYELGSRQPVFHSLDDLNPLFISVTEHTPMSELNILDNFVRCVAAPDIMEDLVAHVRTFSPQDVVKKYLIKESLGGLSSPAPEQSHSSSVKSYILQKAEGLNCQRLFDEYEELV